MAPIILERDDQYLLNHCTRHLARSLDEPRHDFGQFAPGDPRGRICEGWRFPIIDSHGGGADDPATDYASNEVSFVFAADPEQLPAEVGVVGTFARLYEALPLRRIGDTPYFAVTVVVPKGEVHTYRFRVDGEDVLDPVNPQRVDLDNGRTWSRFFTDLCTAPITLEQWEAVLLERLTDHILPFRTTEGRRFLSSYYDGLDHASKSRGELQAYRFDESVGVVNFIDKLLAREEMHHLIDYRICLELIDGLLRARNPFVSPEQMPMQMYVDLYDQMAGNDVPGWDTARYRDPRYFLQLLRRHTLTGAFAHPRYGGNAAGSGWAYLGDRYRGQGGGTLFDWRRSLEPPLGNDPAYRG